MPKTVIIDNYDSFTFNLYQYLGELGVRPLVYRNDKITFEELVALEAERIIISPGPGRPDNPRYFGICKRVIQELGSTVPTLGVCLGHQGVLHAFGARVIRADEVMHGKTSPIRHDGKGIFAGLPADLEVMRYHSLVIDPATVPDCFRVTASTDDGIVMGVEHREHPIYGVQFHPESIGTREGRQLLGNFVDSGEDASDITDGVRGVSEPLMAAGNVAAAE